MMAFERRPGGGWIQESGMVQPTTPTTCAQRKAFARALEGHKPVATKRPNAQRSGGAQSLVEVVGALNDPARARATVRAMTSAEAEKLRQVLTRAVGKTTTRSAPRLTLAGAQIIANAYRQKGKRNR